MPRISKVRWPKLKQDYGWLFDIQNYNDLQGWWENVRVGIAQKDLTETLEYRDGKRHVTVLGSLAELLGISFLDASVKMNKDLGEGLDRVLRDCGRLFINGLGGYFGHMNGLEIIETKEIDVWALPEEKLRIISWPGGSHFYAKIGNEDVVVDRRQKWDTYAEAEAAGNRYLAGKRR